MPPSATAPERPSLPEPLRDALRRRAGPHGVLPFDRFMEVVLYGDGVGYYRRERSPFGPEGDYYTAPRVHPVYASTLAERIRALLGSLDPGRGRQLVDLGAGDGSLIAGLLVALRAKGADAGLEVLVVDRSPTLRAGAVAAAKAAGGDDGPPVRGAPSLAEGGPVRGVVVAHELLDAQPVRRLRWSGAAWQELGVRLEGPYVEPVVADLTAPVPGPPLPVLGDDDVGRVLEVAPAAEATVREVADHLLEGGLLVVDYGAEEAELLAAHPRGTVAAVRGHRSLPFPLADAGSADLSAFVNFTRVRAAAQRAGLVELSYRDQAKALAAWGIEGELARAMRGCRSAEEEVRLRLAAKNLLFGFGSFRVLELAAPCSPPGLLALSGDAGSAGP